MLAHVDEPTPPPGSAPPSAGRVLIVDDDANSRRMLRAILEAEGHDVLEAAHGEQALAMLAECLPDAILLDVQMPGMDGVEVCRRAREDPRLKSVPILMVTGLADREDRLQAIAAGANDYLVKPVDVRDAVLRVRNSVAMARLVRQVEEDYGRLSRVEAMRDDLNRLVVHDMQQPLAVLVNLLVLARSEGSIRSNGGVQSLLTQAASAGDTLAEMVATLDASLRLRAGKLPLRLAEADLSAIVREVALLMEPAARERDVALRVALEPESIVCDRVLVRRILWNLARHAIARSPAGSEIRFHSERRVGRLRVTVADNAPPIPADELNSLFDLSAAKDAESGPAASRTGLVFCRVAVAAHGGETGASHGEGGGNRFWFEIPTTLVPAPPDPTQPAGETGTERPEGRRPAAGLPLEGGLDRPRGLTSLGARSQFAVVLATSAVVPVLALVYAFANSSPGSWTEPGWSWAVAAALLVLLVAGNVLLLRYAIDIKRLRRFLAECVRGMAMTNVELTKPGDDMVRIEAYLNEVKRQSEERLAAVERQSRALIKAEQHRVMIETLGAACHHLGQPATVIRTYLELMRKRETSPELAAMITECLAASDAVSDVLVRLRQVASYRTEPYLPAGDLSAAREDARILKV